MDAPPESHVVLVPMKVDAFVLNDKTCEGNFKLAAIQQPDYAALRAESEFVKSDVLQPIDISGPAGENPRLHNPGTSEDIPSRRGIYLHWVLPQCFRHGVTATQEAMHEHRNDKLKDGFFDGKPTPADDDSLKLAFRACPDRFLIVRNMSMTYYDPTTSNMVEKNIVDCYVVESNLIRFIGNMPQSLDVSVEASPFLDPDIPLERQAEVFLGMKQRAETWAEDGDAVHHSPLTIMDCANPYFADYQPQNAGVFSIHDDMSHHDGTTLWTNWSGGNASYYVLGWHSDPELDPFHLHPDTKGTLSSAERLASCFMDLASGPAGQDFSKWLRDPVAGRTLCHGAIYNVHAEVEGERVGGTRIDQLQDAMNTDHPIAVGETALDALFAYLEVQGSTKSWRTSAELVKEVLALRALLLAREEEPDAQATAEGQLSFEHFEAQNGEGHYHFAAAAEGGGIEAYRPPSGILKRLRDLDDLQRLYDAGVREVHHLRWELFAEWWKAVTFKERPSESQDSLASRKATIRERVEYFVAQLGALLADEEVQENHIAPSLIAVAKDIADLKETIESEKEVTSAQVTLELGTGDRFYLPKDPTVLVAGLPSGWPSGFSDPVRVRLDSQISTNIGTEWRLPGAPDVPSYGTGEVAAEYFARLNNYAMYYNVTRGKEDGSFGPLIYPLANWQSIASQIRRDTSLGRSLYIAGMGPTGMEAERQQHPHGPRLFPGYADELSLKMPSGLRDAARKLLRWEFPFFQWAHKPEPKVPNYVPVPPAYFRDGDRWSEQPLCPLFVEWEVEYWHVDFQHWEYAPDDDDLYRYAIKKDIPVFGFRYDRRVLSGRSLVSAAAQSSLVKAVKELLDTTPVSDDPVLEKYQFGSAQAELLSRITGLEYFSSSLDGFRDQLLTRLRETHIKPSFLLESGSPAVLNKLRNDFGIQQDHIDIMESASETTPFASLVEIAASPPKPVGGVQPPPPCPFKPVTHGQFRFTKYHIVDKFGQVIVAPSPLHPCTSAQYSVNTLSGGAPNSIDAVSAGSESEYVQIPPSINQAARWNSEFMIPGENGTWRPAGEYENPIWGWLMVDYSDKSIQVFLPEGQFLFEIGLYSGGEEKVTLRTHVPGLGVSGPRIGDGGLVGLAINPQLEAFLGHLIPSDATPTPALPFAIFWSLSTALERGSMAFPRDSLTDTLPPTLGRPIALVNTAWSLQLSLPSFENESTLLPGGPSRALADYAFPLKLGDALDRRDGVLGYFLQDPKTPSTSPTFNYRELHTHHFEPNILPTGVESDPRKLISPSTLPTFNPFYIAPSETADAATYAAAYTSKLKVFATLLDPFAPATAHSGILPPTPLSIPPWALERAVRGLRASVRVGPTLLPVDVPGFDLGRVPGKAEDLEAAAGSSGVGVPVPAVVDGRWAWLQPYPGDDGGDARWNALGVCLGDARPRLDERAIPCVVEGFMEMTKPLGG